MPESDVNRTSLTNKVAVVTGGSRGIGVHIAGALHRAGAAVAITGRNIQTLEAAARAIGGNCRPYVADQRDPAAIESMAERIVAEMGGPDILVNNAGVYREGRVSELPLAAWNEVIETNLTGVFLTTRAFLPALLKKPAADIFMISSMSGKKGDPGAAAYAASKFGLRGFSEALMYEVRKHNVRVVVLNPSVVDTREDRRPDKVAGAYLHATDIAATIVHLAGLPGRTMIREIDIYGTNPP